MSALLPSQPRELWNVSGNHTDQLEPVQRQHLEPQGGQVQGTESGCARGRQGLAERDLPAPFSLSFLPRLDGLRGDSVGTPCGLSKIT